MINFPSFDFKIDCGDNPIVRQWLHDNGKYWQSGDLLILSALDRSRLYVESETVSTTISKSFFDRNPLPLINPYDYIPSELTVAERMAELIEKYRTDIPEWARWVAVDAKGDGYGYREMPYKSQYGWRANKQEHIAFIWDGAEQCEYWRETLTEIKPAAIEQDHGTIDSKAEIRQRELASLDQQHMLMRDRQTPAHFEREVVAVVPAPLTLPAACLAEPTSHMRMLGGDFGAMNND
jgi:hypothetical protein